MEEKLMMEAAKLPEPILAFDAIRQKAEKCSAGAGHSHILRRALLAAVVVACLCVSVLAYGKTRYGLWSAYSSHSYADVEILSRRYDYIFPEELGGRSFFQTDTTHGAQHGASHWNALFAPTYKLHSIVYGVQTQMQQGDALYTGIENQISISFGTTETENWKYHFSVAEDGTCNDENVKSDSQSVVEFAGYTLHLYAIGDRYSVRWEDEARKLVIDITCFDTSNFDTAIEAAKTLIGQNK